MDKPYTYALTPSAMRDLDEILTYITERLCAGESAIRLLDAIEAAIQEACRFPSAATPVNDALLRQRGYRKLIVNNYLVLFIPDDERCVLNVMRVVYYARDYMKEL